MADRKHQLKSRRLDQLKNERLQETNAGSSGWTDTGACGFKLQNKNFIPEPSTTGSLHLASWFYSAFHMD